MLTARLAAGGALGVGVRAFRVVMAARFTRLVFECAYLVSRPSRPPCAMGNAAGGNGRLPSWRAPGQPARALVVRAAPQAASLTRHTSEVKEIARALRSNDTEALVTLYYTNHLPTLPTHDGAPRRVKPGHVLLRLRRWPCSAR